MFADFQEEKTAPIRSQEGNPQIQSAGTNSEETSNEDQADLDP